MTTTLYRAADDTYTGYGSCYATDRAVAQTYHANPGMGGSTLISVQLDDAASIVQIDWATLEMLDELVGIETDHDWILYIRPARTLAGRAPVRPATIGSCTTSLR